MNRLPTLTYGKFSDTSHRLASMLFLAALVHGVVILGVTFSGAKPLPQSDVPVLKVTLLADSSFLRPSPEDADYLANRNELGGAAAPDGVRPTTTIAAADERTALGDPRAQGVEDRKPQDPERPVEQLVTKDSSDRELAAAPKATENVGEVPEQAAAKINIRTAQTLAAEVDVEAAVPANDSDNLEASPNTTASVLAAYLDAWRHRVERVGTLNFPEQFLVGSTATRRPTLLVAIGSDGSLEEVVVKNSSGDQAVDNAALNILRMAAPFEPFPKEIVGEFEVLRFAYDWDFIEGRRATSR